MKRIGAANRTGASNGRVRDFACLHVPIRGFGGGGFKRFVHFFALPPELRFQKQKQSLKVYFSYKKKGNHTQSGKGGHPRTSQKAKTPSGEVIIADDHQ
jgi:hypothetical protein